MNLYLNILYQKFIDLPDDKKIEAITFFLTAIIPGIEKVKSLFLKIFNKNASAFNFTLLGTVRDIPNSASKKYLLMYFFDVYNFYILLFYKYLINQCIQYPYIFVSLIIILCLIMQIFNSSNYAPKELMGIPFVILISLNLNIIFAMISFNIVGIYQNILICMLCIFSRILLELIFIKKSFYENCLTSKIFYIRYVFIILLIFVISFNDAFPTEKNIVYLLTNLLTIIISIIFYFQNLHNENYVVPAYINYNDKIDITIKKIIYYKDGKVYYETQDGIIHILDKSLIDKITFEINMPLSSFYRKFIQGKKIIFKRNFLKKAIHEKYIIECHFTNGQCQRYESYNYIDSSWIIFRSNDYKNQKQLATIFDSAKITAIYQVPV